MSQRDRIEDLREDTRLLKELHKLQRLESWKDGATTLIAMLLIETEEDVGLFNVEPPDRTPPEVVEWARDLRKELRKEFLPVLKEKLSDFSVFLNTHPGFALSSLTPLTKPEVTLRKRRVAAAMKAMRAFREAQERAVSPDPDPT